MKFKIIPGVFQAQKFGSDIGWQGLLACGNNTYVQIVDFKSGQLVQTLERHSQLVHLVKWAPENFYHDLKKTYSLKLASSDISGSIIVWEAAYATVLCDFNSQGKKVLDFHWTKYQEVSIDFILALHSGGELILWNTDTGNKVWHKNYSEQIYDFSIDCHDFRNLAFRGDTFVLMVSDFSLTKPPEGNGRKFYICNEGENPPDNKIHSINRMVVSKSTQLIKATTKLVMDIRNGNSENQQSSNCIQVLYHSYCQNHIIIVYPREILIMDLMIFQAVASISLDRSTPNFLKVYSCWQNDILYCLHENGVVTVRGRRPIVVSEDGEIISSQKIEKDGICSNPENSASNSRLTNEPGQTNGMSYDWVEPGQYQLLCQSDIPRLIRNVKVHSMSVAACHETLISIITLDSKIQTWELQLSPLSLEIFPKNNSYLLSPQNLVKLPEFTVCNANSWPVMLYDMIAPMIDYAMFLEAEKTNAVIGSYRFLSDDSKNGCLENKGRIEKWGKLSLNMVSLYQGLLCEPTVIRANPVNMNQSDYPLVAVGNNKGLVQLWNVVTSQLNREFQVIHCPVRGIEWIQAATSSSAARGHLLVYGNSSAGSSTSPSVRVKNNLCVILLETGRLVELRSDIPESPIEMVRVSGLRQYFIVLFKEGPLELWDCRSLKKIIDISMSSNRTLNILEWALGGPNKILVDDSYVKEKFLCIDSGNFFQHVSVEGHIVIYGRPRPIESTINKISTMAYKGQVVIVGDSDGNCLFWNFKSLTLISVPVNQGKIYKIAFDNMKSEQNKLVVIISAEGISTWNWKQSSMVKMIKWGKDLNSRVIGVDWLDDGHTLALLGNSEIRIVKATSLETCCSVVSMQDFSEPVICLSLLPPKMSLAIKSYLQHQVWRKEYTACPELWETEEDIFKDQKLKWLFEQLHKQNIMEPFKLESDSKAKDLATRCYLTAILMGDDYELKFWMVVLKVFFQEKCSNFLPWEMFWSTDIYKFYQKSRLSSLERKRTSHKQTQKCAEAFIMLGDLDRAVRLLLETPPSNPTYVSDLQLACLLANQSNDANRRVVNSTPSPPETIESNVSNAHHSTVKLVATQFISNNCLKEGVQLLCAINKQSDACRYLETYHEWKTAMWLARCTLPENEICDIKKRWALNSTQSQMSLKCNSLLQMLALKDVNKVIEILDTGHQYHLAVRFIEFCELEKVELNSESVTRSKQVFKEFGEFLFNVACKEASNFYLKDVK